jgi:hypothetical protein
MKIVRFQVLTTASKKFSVFWNVALFTGYIPEDSILQMENCEGRTSRYCNVLGVLYSRWNFIALQKSIHYS